MFVTSFVAVAAVVLIVLGEAVAGTAAKVRAPIAAFVTGLVGPAPKPPMPSTRYPQVLTACTTGAACVPADAGIVFPPEVKAVVAVVSFSVNV